jgi:cysteine-rich repeat protein
VCGDTFVQPSNAEQCDDGNQSNTDACVAGARRQVRRRLRLAGRRAVRRRQQRQHRRLRQPVQDATCGDGFVQAGVEQCDDGNASTPTPASAVQDGGLRRRLRARRRRAVRRRQHADCGILTTMNMWGGVARGVDLRAWTGSTLHYLGCNNNGCATNTFYCTFDQNTQKLSFGATSGVVRAAVDPNNALGDTMPNSFNGCCSGPLGLCNGPDSNNNGVNINNAAALCSALGYQNGVVKREAFDNVCPQPHVLNAAGTQWTSDFLINGGYGSEWECTTFK